MPSRNIKSAQFIDSSDDDSDNVELIKVGGVPDRKEGSLSVDTDSDGSGKAGGRGLKGGATKSDNTQFRNQKLKSTDSDSTTDGCSQVGVVTVNSDSGKSSQDIPVKQLQPVAKQPQKRRKTLDVSPLSLLSDASSSEIDSDEVSLSDLDANTKEDEDTVGVVTIISGCGSSSGGSVHSVANSNQEEEEEESKPTMKTKLSLKSKKSWRLNRSEYGIEKREGSSDIGKGSGDISTTDNEGGKGSEGEEKRSPKRKKKNVKKAKYDSQKRRDSSGNDFESPVKKKKKDKGEEDSDEVGGAKKDIVKHRKRHCPVFSSSSDEDDYHNNFESLLTSSEDEPMIVQAPPIPDSHAQSVEFHLERASSEESGLDSSTTPLKKKRKARIVSVSSASSEGEGSCQIIDNSSDEFEDLKRFRSQPVRHGLASLVNARKREKKRKKLSKKKKGFSDDDDDGDGVTTPTYVKEEGSSEEEKPITPSEERVNNTKV